MDTVLPGMGLFLFLSFFFSGIEIAFLSANKLQFELSEKQGILSGKIMAFFVHRPAWFFSTTRIGSIVSLLLFSLFTARLLTPFLVGELPPLLNYKPVIIIIVTLVSTLLILFTTESISKSLFAINPNRILHVLAIPFGICCLILSPLTFLIFSLSKFVSTHILRSPYPMEKLFGTTDMNTFLKVENPVKEDQNLELDKKIFHNALDFKSVRVRECMIPRTEIVATTIRDNIENLTKAFVESGHSKIIIYNETIDDVIGYCHSSALFRNPAKIEDILTPIITVPETTLANELMIRFISERKSLAVVIDEFGGTSGIISMEDVIEEIFGDIEDEHDEDNLIEQQLDNHTYLLSGRHEIDYLNDTYNLSLPVGDYETLGGLILSHTEDFPSVGETIEIPHFTFIIQSTEDNRIGIVRLFITPVALEG